jgi:HD-GYP domain-containing protein (c-di-GMP phosphodiesterase class II)
LASPRIILQGTEHPIQGLRWESENLLRIGRQENQDIVLNHPTVSREHAEVYTARQGWVIRDLGSTSGTFVNGVKLGEKEWKLNQQDVLQCGALTMTVAALEEEAPPPPPPRAPADIKTSGDFSVRIQATAQRSWEKALESLGAEANQRLGHGKHFLTLLRAGYHFCNVSSIEEMLQSILDDTVAVLNAQRGSIVLRDARTGQLEVRAVSVSKPHLKKGKSFSKTLAQRCFSQGESMLCRDVKTDLDLQAARSVQQGTMASIICALFRSPRQRLGVLHLDRGPMQVPFTQDDFYVADAIAASVSVGIETAQLIEKQRDEFFQTVSLVAQTVEVRAPYLAGHGQRVAAYSSIIADDLQLSPAERYQIKVGARLHDIGKIAVDDAVLRKPGILTPEELEQARSHAARGAAILESNPSLAPMVPIVRHHHERWDGQGYPDHLAGENIPRLARIVAVGNAFDALTSDRPYRPALPVERALNDIQGRAGTQFDRECVQALLRTRVRVENVAGRKGHSTSADTVLMMGVTG